MSLEAEGWAAPDIGLDLADHIRLCAGILERATIRLDKAVELGPGGALRIYDAAKELAGLVRDLQNGAEQLLIASVDGARKTEVEGRTVEVRRSWNRKWDQPLVTGAIAACTLEGERIDEVDRVVEAIGKCLYGSTQWKVTELLAMGIDPDKYATKDLGRATVTVS